MLARLRRGFEWLLESITVFLMFALTAVVLLAVVYRKAGASLSWYDEIAEVMLAWLTYYAAALAALKREHIGFSGLVKAVRPSLRIPFLVISEVCVFGFFGLLAWIGYYVLQILAGDTLVSLSWVSIQLTQSVIPIGALLFIIAEALSLPAVWARTRAEGQGAAPGGVSVDEGIPTKEGART